MQVANSIKIFDLFNPVLTSFFDDFVKESLNINIKYEEIYRIFHEDEYYDFKIVSINECDSTEAFKKKFEDLYKLSFFNLTNNIKELTIDEKISIFNILMKSLNTLSNNVVSDNFINFSDNHFHIRNTTFKSFCNATINLPSENAYRFDNIIILYHSRLFAESWLDIVKVALIEIESYTKYLNLLLGNFKSDIPKTNLPKEKIKTTLSVDELAYFFRILAQEKIFDIPLGKKEAYYRFITENFVSKQQIENKTGSLKNR